MRPLRMPRIIPALLLLLCATGAAAQAPAPRGETDPAHFRTVRYEIRYIDLHTAEILAWDQCPPALKDRYQVSGMSTQDSRLKYLDVMADAATHERIARALGKADSAPHTQIFQAVLLAASDRPGGNAPALSAGAQKALADIRTLLPFKSYEQLDSVFLRTTERVDGHLAGRDGRRYGITLRFRSGGEDGKQLFVDLFRFGEESTFPPEQGGKKGPPRNPSELISTSFSLQQGETIVVGTSRSADGDEALVLLLTAVPQA
jgi:hypothetical protein